MARRLRRLESGAPAARRGAVGRAVPVAVPLSDPNFYESASQRAAGPQVSPFLFQGSDNYFPGDSATGVTRRHVCPSLALALALLAPQPRPRATFAVFACSPSLAPAWRQPGQLRPFSHEKNSGRIAYKATACKQREILRTEYDYCNKLPKFHKL